MYTYLAAQADQLPLHVWSVVVPRGRRRRVHCGGRLRRVCQLYVRIRLRRPLQPLNAGQHWPGTGTGTGTAPGTARHGCLTGTFEMACRAPAPGEAVRAPDADLFKGLKPNWGAE